MLHFRWGKGFLIENYEIILANYVQIALVLVAILLLVGILKQRLEFRLWLLADIVLALSYVIVILYISGFGEVLQFIDAALKITAILIAIVAVLLDYHDLYPREVESSDKKKWNPTFAIAFVPLSIFSGITILSCICLFLAIRTYKVKRTPTSAFLALLMCEVIFTTIAYSSRFVGNVAGETYQIWVTTGNITMATTMLVFSMVARVEIDIIHSREMKINLITFASHELKTPLIPIFGWADLLMRSAEKGLDLNKVIDPLDMKGILRNAERLKMIVDQFLDIGMLESGKFQLNREEIGLLKLVTEATKAVSVIAEKKNIKIFQNLPEVVLEVDSFRMQQVLINILSNAIKYSPDTTTIQITGVIKKKEFDIIVQDQGMGFAKDELSEAMKPFSLSFLRKKETQAVPGTCVGLYISKNIVEQHGGRLILESLGQNKGTTVIIRLPRVTCVKS
ncbi:MAG: integral membrane sensor signal transduction histidine kinase [Promethearchaeota archaeon CR_4]|nr:MAG: integral membrane sensor signal transduction histidine kinase [Candidatus Lokiarchaeota archaeon CR_4]